MKTIRSACVLLAIAALGGCPLFWPNQLTVTVSPEGAGAVQLDPARGWYADGETVTLTATPVGAYTLQQYLVDGAPVGSQGDVLELTVTDDMTVEAVFTDQDFGALIEPIDGAMEVSINVGTSPADVYMIFTNVGTTSKSTPAVTPVSGDFGAPLSLPRALPPFLPEHPRALRDYPTPPDRRGVLASRVAGRDVVPPGPLFDTVGATAPFYDYDGIPVASTCRSVVTANGITLAMWVADDDYGVLQYQVSQAMVDSLATQFLKAGSDNDIYEWITGIFGAEWGADAGTGYIADDNTITIFLYDIEGNKASFESTGGIVGFFYAGDNFVDATSNQRLMFYMDAPMLSTKDGPTWQITDWWPEEVVSTLAHEFQHMIHFYQKSVLRGGAGNVAWLNEMSSMVAEDLVADKMDIPGPRGVDPVQYSDGSAGGPDGGGWMLATYNQDNTKAVADWDQTYESYAVNYAFGAYLARNFGGAALFRGIVQNTDSGREAIDTALSLEGYTDTFESALRTWAVANLLSDTVGPLPPYLYNAGEWIPADVGDASYQLGSINLYNYGGGPSYQTGHASIPGDTVEQSASNYYKVATGAVGKLTWQVQASSDVKLEIVVKR